MEDHEEVIASLSPLERKIIPFLSEKISVIIKKSSLDSTSVLRALKFLEKKQIVKLIACKENFIELGDNGILYIKSNLPERQLLNLLVERNPTTLEEAEHLSKLSTNEFKAALGALKKKAIIELKENKILVIASKDEIVKKTLEEQFLESLEKETLKTSELKPEQLHALKLLQIRKDIVNIKEKTKFTLEITELGEKLMRISLKDDYLEELTPEIIRSWNQKKKFRKYDIHSTPPRIHGGKRHFTNQAIEQARKIWLELGFKEISGNLLETAFWNFDALFTPQDHPAREMQDTFYIKGEGKLPEKRILDKIKKFHEQGGGGSKGWQYNWQENEAKKILLRTHTTVASARTLSTLKSNTPVKFFIIGKVFRNETTDWNHEFEFYQSEGIVVDKNANFRHLLGYLKEFYKKMEFEKIRFRPSFFSYTEPSLEIEAYYPEKKQWIELGGAGIFRPEVTIPLLGEYVPVLAWGLGFDRMIRDHYSIKDLRELYMNDMKSLRERKMWLK